MSQPCTDTLRRVYVNGACPREGTEGISWQTNCPTTPSLRQALDPNLRKVRRLCPGVTP